MGFNSVYQSLKELFPQVDTRILKAVAIEYSKDPDSAVESVLTQVLPFLNDQSNIHFSNVENQAKTVKTTSSNSSMSGSTVGKDAHASDMLKDRSNINSVCSNETLDDSLASSFYDAKDTDDLPSSNSKNEEMIESKRFEETGVKAEKNKLLYDHSISLMGACIEDHNNQPSENNMEEARITLCELHDTGVHADKDGIGTVSSTIVTGSGQICRLDLLEGIIEEAKNHKDSLLSAMESTITLVKEVELREKEAQDSKEAATRGGLDILLKVEELKKMLEHAKEANDMHAGEVYGEKSILATEVRELQTRLLGLSDEKDNSLSILDEMRESLEVRLNAAEEEKRAAERELLVKKEYAEAALAEQELVMDKVVQESKLLQQEVDENAKLRDFLMEKGRFVDTLQGEISVICQNIMSLKENFDDNRVSSTKSLSFKQRSFHLSSSNSSVKSMCSDEASKPIGLPESPTPSWTSRTSSTRSVVDKKVLGVATTTQKELYEEDWELFDG